ncbi:MAG: AAA family ATPase [Blastocatellia bacterium]
MRLELSARSLVLLIGASGAGKSTFCRRWFRPTEVLSSDHFRAMLTDDESDQSVNEEAFGLLYQVMAERLSRGRRTVLDATSVRAEDRQRPMALARQYGGSLVAIVFALPPSLCRSRNAARPQRRVPEAVLEWQLEQVAASLELLPREGFDQVLILRSEAEVAAFSLSPDAGTVQ